MVQKQTVMAAIKYTNGNLMYARDLLGISRQTLYRLIDVHSIDLKQIRDNTDQIKRKGLK